MMRKLMLVLTAIFAFRAALASVDPGRFIQGYARTVSGAMLDYTFPLLGPTPALLVRATDGQMATEWQSEPVRTHESGICQLLWYAGLGCNLGEKKFHLAIDGKPVLTFSSADRDSWSATGADSVRLAFTTLSKDRYQDRFGLMSLHLPASVVSADKGCRLRITGEAAGSDAWVMTFCKPVQEEISLIAHPALLKDDRQPQQPVDLILVHLKDDAEAIARCGKNSWRFPVGFGVNRQLLKIPPVTGPKTVEFDVQVGAKRYHQRLAVSPVQPRTIYLVQHAHTDIGYTKAQDEILSEHLRYIDYALDYCDQTDSLPDDARFRWTCETSWAPWKYLQCRPPAQIDRLKKRVLEGRIELTAMMLNFGEIADENILANMLEALALFKESKLPVVTAMQNDVNGFAWCLVDYLADCGVRYVTMGENTARALEPFDQPTPFWWESPSGRRLLAFRADHYMTGNFAGLHIATFDQVERDLFAYLNRLEVKKYPYDAVSIQYSGYGTDNAPPSTHAMEIIRQWNEKYESPKLRSATAQEFLRWIEEHEASKLPVYRAAWPDWWTDGFGSAMRETAAVRRVQADLVASQGLLSLYRLTGEPLPPAIKSMWNAAVEQVLFYDEHTFGAAESISDPLAENSQVQWREKASMIWDAAMRSRMLCEAALRLLEEKTARGAEASITVFNTLNFPRGGICRVFVDHQLSPKGRALRAEDQQGRILPAQYTGGRAEGSYWDLWVDKVPAFGSRTFRICPTETSAAPATIPTGSTVIENRYYRITLDRCKGAVLSVCDKETDSELVDGQSDFLFGQFIYETLSDRHPMELYQLGPHQRTMLRNVRITPGENGPVWRSLIVSGEADGCMGPEGVRCEVRLFETAKKIELVYRIRKSSVVTPEAIYIAFPVLWSQANWRFEAQGGMVRPGIDQLPGSANDWNTVQDYAALRGPGGQLIICSESAPLMQFGAINTGRYQPVALPQTSHIYSWVLNNYWSTNFVASQEGDLEWRYTLTSTNDGSELFASQFGQDERVPLLGMVLPPACSKEASLPGLSVNPELRMISLKPSRDDKGLILQVREVSGKNEKLDLHGPGIRRVSLVNAVEEELPNSGPIEIGPLASRFVKLWLVD